MPRPSGTYLSIIIPAFNEAARIEPTLDKITDYLDEQSYKSEVLVVADGSTDQTLPRVSRAALWRQYINPLDNRVNRGKGAAVHHGMLSANGEVLLYADADLPAPIGEVGRLIEALEAGADVAIASRRVADSTIRVPPPWWSSLASGLFGGFVRATVLPGMHDVMCGFKLFRRTAAFDIFPRQRIEQFCFDVELLRIAPSARLPRCGGAHRLGQSPSEQIPADCRLAADFGRRRADSLLRRARRLRGVTVATDRLDLRVSECPVTVNRNIIPGRGIPPGFGAPRSHRPTMLPRCPLPAGRRAPGLMQRMTVTGR